MDLMKLEELLKFHEKILTRSGVIWISRGLLNHFDPGMSVKVKTMDFNSDGASACRFDSRHG